MSKENMEGKRLDNGKQWQEGERETEREDADKSKNYTLEEQEENDRPGVKIKKGSPFCTLDLLYRLVPLIHCLFVAPYSWKGDLAADIVAGITIAVMMVPQGMAYALLAGAPPIMGIYAGIFPVLAYAFFGPSRQNSVGANAVVGMLTFEVVEKLAGDMEAAELITLICLMVGIWQILLWCCGFGRLSWLMSDILMSGFTTACTVHIATSQLKEIFGVSLAARSESVFKIFYIYKDMFSLIPEANPVTMVIGITSVVILVLDDNKLKPLMAKKTRFPFPVQVIVVIVGTLLSYYWDMANAFKVATVGEIPQGLPSPSLPSALLGNGTLASFSLVDGGHGRLWLTLLADSLAIAATAYGCSLAMGKMGAQKAGDELDGNQQLLAEGIANVFGSFFQSVATAASISRSLVQANVGGRTQLASLVSASLLIGILLFVGPLLQYLPRACLAAIVLVPVRKVFRQLGHFSKYSSHSLLDGLVWLCSFLSVLLVDIVTGLALGLVLNIILVLIRGCRVKVSKVKWDAKEERLTIGLEGHLTFASYERVFSMIREAEALERRVQGRHIENITLDLWQLKYLDQTAASKLLDYVKKNRSKVKIDAAGETPDQVQDMLRGVGGDEETLKENYTFSSSTKTEIVV